LLPDAALTILCAIPRARGGAERRAESGTSFGPRRRSISSSTAIAKFCSTDGSSVDHIRCGRARARLGGAMLLDLLDRRGRCSGSWPQDSMVRSPAAPSPIPFS
jgi:hypothetical protein